MILVVFSHLYIPNDTTVNQLFINFRMPLFFFLSGLLSLRLSQSWSAEELRRRITTKARTLLLPTVIFGLLFVALSSSEDVGDLILSTKKSGYWFTIVLFEMLSIYYLLRYSVERRGGSGGVARTTKGLFAVACTLSFLWSERWLDHTLPSILCVELTMRYMPYFSFGLLVGCNREKFDKVIDSHAAYATIVALFGVLSWAIINNEGSIRVPLHFAVGFAGIGMLYGLFRRLRAYFDGERPLARAMKYMGQHTLEVYVLHYILLINFTPLLYPYIADVAFPGSPLVVGLPVAALVAVVALGIGWLLGRDKHIAYYALGRR